MVKQIFKIAKRLRNPFYSPVPVQPGLEPVMGDLYRTPTPNLDNYDNGNIFINPPIPRVDIVYDGCNIGLQVNPSYLLAKYPPVQIVYRNPECNLPKPIELPEFSPLREFIKLITACTPGRTCYYTFVATVKHIFDDANKYSRELIKGTLADLLPIVTNDPLPSPFNYAQAESFSVDYNTNKIPPIHSSDLDYGVYLTKFFVYDAQTGEYESSYYYVLYAFTYSHICSTNSNETIIVELPRISLISYTVSEDTKWSNLKWQLAKSTCDLLPLPPIISPPLPPMTCNCCPNIQQNDELLRLILKRIGEPKEVTIFDEDMERDGAQEAKKGQETLFNAAKIATDRVEITNRLIGIANFPVKVPDTVIAPHKEGIFEQIFDFLDGDKEREIKTVTELITWMAEQDSAVLGQFHQVIEFEQDFDGDGNTKSETVVLPNVAESLKEVILLLVQLANGEGTKLHALVKILAEVNNLKVNLFKTMQTVIDIQDYLDYPTNTKKIDVPLSCTFKLDDKEDLEDFFVDSKGAMTFEDWDGTNSLHDNMLDLMQVAAMLRTMLFQRD